jgi:hypothetical protein
VTFVIGVFFCLMIAILTALAGRRKSRKSGRVGLAVDVRLAVVVSVPATPRRQIVGEQD